MVMCLLRVLGAVTVWTELPVT